MTRFPVFSSLVAVIPLAALGWPLANAIKAPPAQIEKTDTTETTATIRADLSVRSAHPFEKLTVTIAGASWTLTPETPDQELYIPRSEKLPIIVSASWPTGTPETAILLELMPDGLETRTQTLWGLGDVSEELTFTWNSD